MSLENYVGLIPAIKVIRAVTGMALKEAKDLAERKAVVLSNTNNTMGATGVSLGRYVHKADLANLVIDTVIDHGVVYTTSIDSARAYVREHPLIVMTWLQQDMSAKMSDAT